MKRLVGKAAVVTGSGVWATHFVAMLAVRLPFSVDYIVFHTLLSFLVCVLVVGAAVFASSAGPLTATRLAASAVFMGAGIASMHSLGMAALHAREARSGDRALRPYGRRAGRGRRLDRQHPHHRDRPLW